jgi:hypothetical protein
MEKNLAMCNCRQTLMRHHTPIPALCTVLDCGNVLPTGVGSKLTRGDIWKGEAKRKTLMTMTRNKQHKNCRKMRYSSGARVPALQTQSRVQTTDQKKKNLMEKNQRERTAQAGH